MPDDELYGRDSDESSDESDQEADFGRYAELNEEEEQDRNAALASMEAKLSPEELFAKYDTDQSGYISLEEFLTMLPAIGINVARAKGIRIFNKCDTDSGGEIDLDEFKMALFACDSNSGNTQGFSISNLLGPRDAFDLFDEDGSGQIDELEFADVLEYLGLDVSDEVQEKMFLKYDADESGFIDYEEFRTMWVVLSDVESELRARKVEIPTKATKAQLHALLEHALEAEEKAEMRAIREAAWWHDWKVEQSRRKKLGERAIKRAQDELAAALDAAGQVYMLGSGSTSQFESPSSISSLMTGRPSSFEVGYNDVLEMWNERIYPTYVRPVEKKLKAGHVQKEEEIVAVVAAPEVEEVVVVPETLTEKKKRMMVRRRPQKATSNTGKLTKQSAKKLGATVVKKEKISKSRVNKTKEEIEMEKLLSEDLDYIRSLRFSTLRPLKCTVWLWGRRIVDASLSDSVAYALSDSGQVYTWGGSSSSSIVAIPDDDSDNSEHSSNNSEDDSEVTTHHHQTPRTELLKMTRRRRRHREQELEGTTTEEEEEEDEQYHKLTRLCKYYDVWTSPPTLGTRMTHLQKILLPQISFKVLEASLRLRSFDITNKTKNDLVTFASNVFALEVELKGEVGHEEYKVSDLGIQNLQENSEELSKNFSESYADVFQAYNERQDAELKLERERLVALDNAQEEAFKARAYQARVTQEDLVPAMTECGTSRVIEFSGITARGPQDNGAVPGGSAVWKINAGGHHAALLTPSGDLYTWGLGTLGKLGHGYDANVGNACLDYDRPKKVISLSNIPIKDVSCSSNFTIALSTTGKLFSFGSLTGCGVGGGKKNELLYQFTSTPLPVKLSASNTIRQVSCGKTHAAAVNSSGELYVWGSANGGKLGLGPSIRDRVNIPTLVLSLRNTRVASVSCGTGHSALVTEIQSDATGYVQNTTGGHLYVTGNIHALGKAIDTWTRIESTNDTPMKAVSCGHAHTGCVSSNGEVYLWGLNTNGCVTGQDDLSTTFVSEPTKLKALHDAPSNLARGRSTTRQSSLYNMQGPERAVNGVRDGHLKNCIHTQYDDRPWFEVDLGQPVVIQRIRVWNRTDRPNDINRRKDEFMERLFPFVIMVSEIPFTDEAGSSGLARARSQSVVSASFHEVRRMTEFVLPSAETVGQYVRVQLDSTNFLHIAEVEVYGAYSVFKYVGQVSAVSCGNATSLVVMRPLSLASVVKDYYLRAVTADPDYAKILRQFDTYREYYESEDIESDSKSCRLCRAHYECEICAFLRLTPSDNLPRGPLGERLGLKEVVRIISNREPPRLDFSKEEAQEKAEAELKRQAVMSMKEKKKSRSFKLPVKSIPTGWSREKTASKLRSKITLMKQKVNNKVYEGGEDKILSSLK